MCVCGWCVQYARPDWWRAGRFICLVWSWLPVNGSRRECALCDLPDKTHPSAACIWQVPGSSSYRRTHPFPSIRAVPFYFLRVPSALFVQSWLADRLWRVMHVAVGWMGWVNESRPARNRAHSEIFGIRGPRRAAQGPFYTLRMGKCSSHHPSLERNYGKNVALFPLHFSSRRDSVEPLRETWEHKASWQDDLCTVETRAQPKGV